MNEKKTVILAVDDNPEHLGFFVDNLELAGYEVHGAENGLVAKQRIKAAVPALMILDLQMPMMNGFEVLEWLRTFSDLPVIIVTARDAEDDKVRGLRMGADDYLVKPIGSRELQARVKVLLRRAYPPPAAGDEARPPYRNGSLSIDFGKRRVCMDGEEVHLAPILYQLLTVFAERTDCVLEHEYLLERVWGKDWVEGGLSILRANISRLRNAIEPDCEDPTYIVVVPRVGYRLKQQ